MRRGFANPNANPEVAADAERYEQQWESYSLLIDKERVTGRPTIIPDSDPDKRSFDRERHEKGVAAFKENPMHTVTSFNGLLAVCMNQMGYDVKLTRPQFVTESGIKLPVDFIGGFNIAMDKEASEVTESCLRLTTPQSTGLRIALHFEEDELPDGLVFETRLEHFRRLESDDSDGHIARLGEMGIAGSVMMAGILRDYRTLSSSAAYSFGRGDESVSRLSTYEDVYLIQKADGHRALNAEQASGLMHAHIKTAAREL